MKQLLILSGKGGTGKTTLAAAFIKLAEAKAYADCDVDAPNLHLVSGWTKEPKLKDYFGLPKAEINADLCIQCGLCKEHCRFGAIEFGEAYRVNPFACEGCSVCELVCPTEAISRVPSADGELSLYVDEEKVFSTAELKMGSGTSGLLVTEVKKGMQSATKEETKLAIIDGSPGIGCPVIASLSGVDMVLIVAEPSLSGISDMERIIKTAAHFGIKTAVCVNKSDTNPSNTQKIEDYCEEHGLAFAGKIPFDPQAVKATNKGQSIVDCDCPSGIAAKKVFGKTMAILSENGGE